MNILPKKRWHVRTKDNIARVRRDEAAAHDEEQKRLGKLELAESEARINFLRSKSGLPDRPNATVKSNDDLDTAPVATASGHVDIFADYKSHIKQTNKDLEKEKKEEQEKYEKQIGYLTYLGQDTNEALKLRSWYEVAPIRAVVGERDVVEKDLKSKYSNDPLTLINALLPPEKLTTTLKKQQQPLQTIAVETIAIDKSAKIDKIKKHKSKEKKQHKKHKKHKKSQTRKSDEILRKNDELQRKKDMLEKLRKERLRREASERLRQEQLIAPIDVSKDIQSSKTTTVTPRIVQKYNSQFNPELAKQNMI